MPTQYLILTGCNDFGVPGAELKGCINDLRHVYDTAARYFNHFGFKFYILHDSSNTAKAARELIGNVIADAQAGDPIWLHNSSHGTFVPVDGRNEHANCAYGFDWNDPDTFMLGTHYQTLFAAKKPGTPLTFTNDACNSGNMMSVRAINRLSNPAHKCLLKKFVAPPDGFQMQLDHMKNNGILPSPRGLLGNLHGITYISGCGPKDTDYSADVTDPATGASGGAFSTALCDYLNTTLQNSADPTNDVVTQAVCKNLAADQFDQQPVLDSDQADKTFFWEE